MCGRPVETLSQCRRKHDVLIASVITKEGFLKNNAKDSSKIKETTITDDRYSYEKVRISHLST